MDGRNRHYRMAPSLDEPARALWSIVSHEIDGSGVYATDRERAQEILKERRLRSEAFFASAAERWDETRERLFGSAALTAPLLGLLRPAWTVADLGTGTGALAECLAPHVGKVVAVDRSARMLDAARLRLAGLENVDVREGDLEDLPMENEEVDVAFLTLVLHYVVDPPAVLAEVHRVLARGGTLVLVDMRLHERAEPYAEEMGHVWPGFEPERVASWLDQAGFASVHTMPLPPDPAATGPLLFLASALKA